MHLIADESFSYAVTARETVKVVINHTGFVYAPVVQGQNAGYAYVCLEDQPVGKIPLIFGETVEQELPEKPSFWERLFGGD